MTHLEVESKGESVLFFLFQGDHLWKRWVKKVSQKFFVALFGFWPIFSTHLWSKVNHFHKKGESILDFDSPLWKLFLELQDAISKRFLDYVGTWMRLEFHKGLDCEIKNSFAKVSLKGESKWMPGCQIRRYCLPSSGPDGRIVWSEVPVALFS